jgi:hypothetical protein
MFLPRYLIPALILARRGYDPAPPRFAVTLARLAVFAAAGGVLAVLALPVLAILGHLLP